MDEENSMAYKLLKLLNKGKKYHDIKPELTQFANVLHKQKLVDRKDEAVGINSYRVTYVKNERGKAYQKMHSQKTIKKWLIWSASILVGAATIIIGLLTLLSQNTPKGTTP